MKATMNCDKLVDGKLVNLNNTFIMDFMNQNVVRRTMEYQLQKIIEDWAKVKLNKNFVMYGIRRYTRGAVLLQHVDKIPRCEIFGFFLLSRSVFTFQFLNDTIHNYVKVTIIVNCIIQKLKSKHTFLKKYTN